MNEPVDEGQDQAGLVRRALDDFLEFASEVDISIVSLARAAYLDNRLTRLASEALASKLGEAVNRLPVCHRQARKTTAPLITH